MYLGGWLQSNGLWGEVATIFSMSEYYADVLVANPQYLSREPLKPKAEEKMSDIVVAIVAIEWGILNWDNVFCNAVAMNLRNLGIFPHQAGPTPPP